jgi:twitching motility protein PilJ
MAFNLKLPKFLSGGKGRADQTVSAPTLMDDVQPVTAIKKISSSGPGFLGQFSVAKKLQVLGVFLLLMMLIIGVIVYRDNRESTYASAYIGTAGEMRMISQRLAKSASLALQGNTNAFKQLRDANSQFITNLGRLTYGGELANIVVPASPEAVQPQLKALSETWAKTQENAELLSEMERNLVTINQNVSFITNTNSRLLVLTEQVAKLKQQGNANVNEVAAANQLVMLSQRISKSANELILGDDVNAQTAFQLAKDDDTFQYLLGGLIRGSEALRLVSTTDAETKIKLGELEESYKSQANAINAIVALIRPLTLAKEAGANIFRGSEELLDAADSLSQAYQQGTAERTVYGIGLAILITLALTSLIMMAKIYLDDARHQAELADQSRQASELVNRQNQDAILRLMNELGDLADGDLTVTATVSEDITGAIADSINYTIEELRVLVGRINDAAGRVTVGTGIAQQTSAELLDAAKRQSLEIKAAGHSVLAMASSMTQVSSEASQSAQVARQSLAAASKGTQAVQDSIKGMNEIRDQIQETSKRIKRLGESSQEIGEIVELISDITEQTNVLALNAAIQAASAGDAGRGFTVVAEEVQRLAERSGEATKQIAAIVKTIQTDTQGAVSAMEESTRGVVEGAKLSDAAGQALSEIGEVSQNLADLIANISDATREQADSATGVAGKMQDILHVTEQTTAGTQKTATAVGELAGLATELKGSVAGFKVG